MGDFEKKTDGRREGEDAGHWQIGKNHRKVNAACYCIYIFGRQSNRRYSLLG